MIKNNTMNLSTRSTSKNPKNIIIESNTIKRGKCQCGKTKDSDGNCDGSHANKEAIAWFILFRSTYRVSACSFLKWHIISFSI